MILNTLGKSILLDTSIVVQHFRNNNKLEGKLAPYEHFLLPQVALGELYGGAFRSLQPEKNIFQIERFLESIEVLTTDEQTPLYYGRLAAELSKIGQSIQHNDIWIAAIALQYNLPVATLDNHFKRIDGIKVILI